MISVGRCFRFAVEERGSILILSLFVLTVLASLLAVLLTLGGTELLISGNLLHGNQTVYLAEAGIERALAQLMANPKLIAAAPSQYAPFYEPQRLGTVGNYSVRYRAAGVDTVLIESRGEGLGNAQRVLRAIVSTTFVPSAALQADQSIIVTGSSRVEGERGGIHSNSTFSVRSDAPDRPKSAGPESAGGFGTARREKRDIPVVNTDALQPYADFILGDTSILETKTGLTHSPGWSGWERVGPGEWRHTGSDAPVGTYLASKKIILEGDAGTLSAPWQATFIAGDEVLITGTVVLVPMLKDLLVASGRRIFAQSRSNWKGLVIANEVVELGGSITISGSVVSKGEIRVQDDVVVSFDGPLRTPFTVAPWVVLLSPIGS